MVPSNHLPPAVRLSRRSTLLIGVLCILIAAVLFAVLVRPAFAQKALSAAEAKDHVGETATVCGTVASTHYAASTRGRPTFLNLDKPYPSPIFTIVIWGSDRDKFGEPPEVQYKGKRICVSGKIELYRGVPEIIADSPRQLTH